MKGQANVVTTVTVAIGVAVTVLVGLAVYGVSQNLFPHDETFLNESVCTTCVNGSNGATTYALANLPVVNDTTLVCSNATGGQAMTNGLNDGTCLGYNYINPGTINITNTSGPNACQITNMRCSYVQDNADAERQSFYTSVNSTIFSGFALAAVLVIILAAAIIITVVFLIRP